MSVHRPPAEIAMTMKRNGGTKEHHNSFFFPEPLRVSPCEARLASGQGVEREAILEREIEQLRTARRIAFLENALRNVFPTLAFHRPALGRTSSLAFYAFHEHVSFSVKVRSCFTQKATEEARRC